MQNFQQVAGPERGRLLSPTRVIVFSLLSNGFYVFYWAYLTWKQLASETHETHYPVWHGFSLLVPFYGVFRMHQHLSVISEVAMRAGLQSLSPGAGIAMYIVANVLGFGSNSTSDVTAVLVLFAISTVLYTVVMTQSQRALNGVWLAKYPAEANSAPLSWVEVVLAVLGLLVWASAFVPA